MKHLQFIVTLLLLLVSFVTQAQQYRSQSPRELQKRLAAFSPAKAQSVNNSRSIILLDSTLCNLELPFGEDPLENKYFEYNEEHQLIKDSTFIWDFDFDLGGFEKIPILKQYHTYTPTGEVHIIKQLDWDREINAWAGDTIRLVHYYEGGRLQKIANDYYDTETQEWYTDVYETFLYDGNDLIGIIVGWYVDESIFVPIARVDFTLNQGQIVKEEYYFSFDGGEEWVEFFYTEIEYILSRPVASYTYFYDEELEEYLPLESTYTIYNEYELKGIDVTYIWFDEWLPFRSCHYYYTENQVSAVKEKIQPLSELIMPNPFPGGLVSAPALSETGMFHIDLIDIHGRVVYSHAEYGNIWTLAAPPKPGMYLVQVRQNNQIVANRKIITP